jgi:hypothetical protein
VRRELGVAAILLGGCVQGGVFPCTSDAQCKRSDGSGTCEALGWCAYPDPSCMPSGQRYGDFVGGGLADQCVGGTTGGGACGGTGVVTDNFDDGVTAPQWLEAFPGSGPTHYAETGGQLVITTGSGEASADYAGYQTFYTYDLRNDSVYVEVLSVPPASTHSDAYIRAYLDANDFLAIQDEAGYVHFDVGVTGSPISDLGAVAWDPVATRWWRIRETSGTVYFETSPDATTWTVHAQTPDPFDLSAVHLNIAAGTYRSEAVTGQAIFDNYNGGGTPEPLCPLARFTDGFDKAGAVIGRWDSSDADPGCTASNAGGQAVMTPPTTAAGYCDYTSTGLWDLRGSYAAIHIVQMLNTAVDADAFMDVRLSQANVIEIGQDLGVLHFGKRVGGTYTTIVNDIPWDAVQHAWWRIREASGTVYIETAPDGRTWTVQATTPDPFDLSAIGVRLGAGTTTTISNAGSVIYDDFNLLP